MKKLNKTASKVTEQLLGKFFTFEGKVATLKLVYDTFAELVNANFGDDRTEKLNGTLFDDIKEAVEILPRGYSLNVQVNIRDFGEYSREECENIITQNINLATYLALKSGRGHLRNGLTLMGIGAAVLIASYLLHSVEYDIIFDVVNISGTLCVWEGANTAFLERNMERKAAHKVAKIIRNITVVQGN